MTTLTTDPWTLLTPHPPTYQPRWPQHDNLPTTCHPRCTHCHHPEGRGLCRRCLLICDHTTQKTRRKLVDICLIRQHATARTATSPSTGRQLLIVDHCPTCARPHIHANEPNLGPYRLPPCREPYLLDEPWM